MGQKDTGNQSVDKCCVCQVCGKLLHLVVEERNHQLRSTSILHSKFYLRYTIYIQCMVKHLI